ncbi:MAG: XdhC family protein [Rubritepida sp.]|nr:XdhC family protein [Rubritepida sp.]
MSDDLLTTAAAWRANGEQVAIATVVETWGSSPRPAGSRFIVSDAGHMAGSVSGGCIEGAVAQAAATTMATGAPQLLDFGISDETAWEVGLACGGKLQVFLEKLG